MRVQFDVAFENKISICMTNVFVVVPQQVIRFRVLANSMAV